MLHWRINEIQVSLRKERFHCTFVHCIENDWNCISNVIPITMLDISASKNYTIVISENKDCLKGILFQNKMGPVLLCPPVPLQVIDWKWKFQLTSLLCKNDFQRVRWQVPSWWWTLLRLEFSTLQHLTRIQVFFKLQKSLGYIHLNLNLESFINR